MRCRKGTWGGRALQVGGLPYLAEAQQCCKDGHELGVPSSGRGEKCRGEEAWVGVPVLT